MGSNPAEEPRLNDRTRGGLNAQEPVPTAYETANGQHGQLNHWGRTRLLIPDRAIEVSEKVAGVRDAIEARGATLRFLPSNLPDLYQAALRLTLGKQDSASFEKRSKNFCNLRRPLDPTRTPMSKSFLVLFLKKNCLPLPYVSQVQCRLVLNPIEQVLAKLKSQLPRAAPRTGKALWKSIGQLLDV